MVVTTSTVGGVLDEPLTQEKLLKTIQEFGGFPPAPFRAAPRISRYEPYTYYGPDRMSRMPEPIPLSPPEEIPESIPLPSRVPLLMEGPITVIETPDALGEEYEDWSACRSPSRAMRRARLGHRQRMVKRRRPAVLAVDGGATMLVHPEIAAELRRRTEVMQRKIEREAFYGNRP